MKNNILAAATKRFTKNSEIRTDVLDIKSLQKAKDDEDLRGYMEERLLGQQAIVTIVKNEDGEYVTSEIPYAPRKSKWLVAGALVFGIIFGAYNSFAIRSRVEIATRFPTERSYSKLTQLNNSEFWTPETLNAHLDDMITGKVKPEGKIVYNQEPDKASETKPAEVKK